MNAPQMSPIEQAVRQIVYLVRVGDDLFGVCPWKWCGPTFQVDPQTDSAFCTVCAKRFDAQAFIDFIGIKTCAFHDGRCSAKRRDGQPCRQTPVFANSLCRYHGGHGIVRSEFSSARAELMRLQSAGMMVRYYRVSFGQDFPTWQPPSAIHQAAPSWVYGERST